MGTEVIFKFPCKLLETHHHYSCSVHLLERAAVDKHGLDDIHGEGRHSPFHPEVHAQAQGTRQLTNSIFLHTVNIRNPDDPDFESSSFGHNLCPDLECLAAILFLPSVSVLP
jgi:hypothetical protein